MRSALFGCVAWLAACAAPAGECEELGVANVVASRGEGLWVEQGRRPRLVEVQRTGGLAEGQELAFPASMAAREDGSVVIPDFSLAEVVFIDPDGSWSRLARRGSGPGELAAPVAARFTSSGAVAVFDIGAARVEFYDESGEAAEGLPVAATFVAPILASGELEWAAVQGDGAALIKTLGPSDAEGLRNEAVLRLRPGSTQPDTLATATVRVISAGGYDGVRLPGEPFLRAAVSDDGQFATATERSYRIDVRDSAGSVVRVICREAPTAPIGARELGEGGDAMPMELREAFASMPMPDRPAAFGRMFWSTEGGLWVQRDRPAPLGDWLGVPGATYDVFDAGGIFLGSLQAPPRARLHAASGDRVWSLEQGELGEVHVVAYRIEL